MTFENWWATLTTREKARMVRDDVAEAWAAATAAEREACAKACDDVRQQTVKGASDSYLEGRSVGATVCMSFIRARSNAKVTGAEGVRVD